MVKRKNGRFSLFAIVILVVVTLAIIIGAVVFSLMNTPQRIIIQTMSGIGENFEYLSKPFEGKIYDDFSSNVSIDGKVSMEVDSSDELINRLVNGLDIAFDINSSTTSNISSSSVTPSFEFEDIFDLKMYTDSSNLYFTVEDAFSSYYKMELPTEENGQNKIDEQLFEIIEEVVNLMPEVDFKSESVTLNEVSAKKSSFIITPEFVNKLTEKIIEVYELSGDVKKSFEDFASEYEELENNLEFAVYTTGLFDDLYKIEVSGKNTEYVSDSIYYDPSDLEEVEVISSVSYMFGGKKDIIEIVDGEDISTIIIDKTDSGYMASFYDTKDLEEVIFSLNVTSTDNKATVELKSVENVNQSIVIEMLVHEDISTYVYSLQISNSDSDELSSANITVEYTVNPLEQEVTLSDEAKNAKSIESITETEVNNLMMKIMESSFFEFIQENS